MLNENYTIILGFLFPSYVRKHLSKDVLTNVTWESVHSIEKRTGDANHNIEHKYFSSSFTILQFTEKIA